jgi:cytoskeletal protein RodZ
MSREVEKKSPGTILKNARLAMGLSLPEVAAISRIPRTMLSHLEANRFDEYSADVFVRGHLRGYARELKLDAETVIQAFERHTGSRVESPIEIPERRAAARKSISKAGTTARKQVAGFGSQMSSLTRGVRASHLVAVGLVLVFLFIVVNFLTGSRATANDTVQFPTASEDQWEVEQAAQETRWALEQPAGVDDSLQDIAP